MEGRVENVHALTVLRARRGEAAAIRSLIRTHQAAVHALVSRILVTDPGSVDDVCQEALIKAVRALDRFDPDGPAPVGRWMLTIATRTAIDHLRRHRRRREDGVEGLDDRIAGGASPETQVDGRRQVARIAQIMARLPADQRAALVLRAYHDLDYDEIASALQVRVGTVKSRIARARTFVRRALEAEVSHV